MITKHKEMQVNYFLKQRRIRKKLNKVAEVDVNDIPYLSVYYYEPLISTEEEAIVPIYITDFYQKEYAYNDESLRFTVRVQVDENVRYIENLKAGDHNINLGKLPKGDHHFNFEVIDEYNRKSCRVFNELRVKNPSDFIITSSQTYTITEQDLNRHNIKNNNSQVIEDMINCRVGLTALFKEIRDNGYKKCILPFGTYRVNRTTRGGTGNDTPIDLASGLTIDMNGSTFKMHQYDDRMYGDKGSVDNLLIRMDNCEETHLINGILEGDYFERQELIWEEDGTNAINGGNGEHDNTLYIYGGKYNTLQDIELKQTTGYSLCTTFGKATTTGIASFRDSIAINENGEEYSKEGVTTSGFTDITKLLSGEYICASVYLGYAGIKGMHWDSDINFYDENKNFIEGFKLQQHRRAKIPARSKFAKLTLRCESSEVGSICFHNQPSPKYCAFKNIEAIDNRTCVAPFQFQHLLMENINFTRSGQSITPLAIDIEDGWEQSQDLYIKKCIVKERSGSGDLVLCAGINIVVEECENFDISARYRVNGLTIRNNDTTSIILIVGYMAGNTFRFYGNNKLSGGYLSATYQERKEPIVFKNNVCSGGEVGSYYIEYTKYEHIYNRCDIIEPGYNDNALFKECNFYRTNDNRRTSYIPNFRVYDSNFYTENEDLPYIFSFNKLNADRILKNCNFYADTHFLSFYYFNNGLFEDCNFHKTLYIQTDKENNMGDINFTNCVFEKDVTIKLEKGAKIQFNNCTFKGNRVFKYDGQNNSEFNNCTFL